MRSITALLLLVIAGAITSCSQNASQSSGSSELPTGITALPAADFSQKLQAHPEVTLLDVRTPEEYESGHLEKALNVNVNDVTFAEKVNKLDHNKPVFLYCLSGGRSASAARFLQSQGFKTVIDLQGGMMQWRAAKLPVVTLDASPKPTGMSQADFEKMVNSPKMVLVDFYAVWCQPCKKLAPHLEAIKNEMSDQVQVISIDTDQNQALAEALDLKSIPTLMLYKKGKLAWRNVGYIDKESIVAQLK